MNQAVLAKQPKRPKHSKTKKIGKPDDLASVLEYVRALWESTEAADKDVGDDLRGKITDTLVRLDTSIRAKNHLADVIRSRHKAEAAQAKLFTDEPSDPLPPRFDEPDVRVFVTDLAEQALKYLPDSAKFENVDEYQTYLVERLSYNSISTRKRNANYLINRFFPGPYLHPDLTTFAAAAGEDRLGDALFYLTARSERILQIVAEKVVWPALPVGGVGRNKIRDLVKNYLKTDDPAKRTTIAIAQCYGKFGVGKVSKTKIGVSIRFGDLATFAYLLHLEFPEPGMQSFEKLLDGPLHKWLLWDRPWMIEQLYRCRQLGLLSKVSEIDSMRQFTTKYSLAEASERIAKLFNEESA